jgi:hypothetical protein
MKNFVCAKCSNKVYFENTSCLKCESALGFDPDTTSIITLEPSPRAPGLYRSFRRADRRTLKYCANASHGVCNWLVPDDGEKELCQACSLNRIIPNLAEPGSLEAWRDLERAKKRLIYSLLRFGLPFDGRGSEKGPLTFDFVRDAVTGHLDGVITIDVTEADAVERERQRRHFDEPYRSLLGHLRHESGHYFWMVIVEGAGRLQEFRALFGDERADYAAALARHHSEGPSADWSERHVSAYASAHPWEDWAETWAHYLHMVSALDTAEASGMEPRAAAFAFGAQWAFKSYDAYRQESFPALMERWIPLAIALNSLSRSMGHDDFYPFVIPAPAYDKLAFVHNAIRAARARFNPGRK